MDAKAEFLNMLDDAVEDTGLELSKSREEIAAYMAERADHLSAIVEEPGFGRAVIAERNSVAMFIGLEVSDNAHAADHRALGWIAGALRIAAVVLA